MIGFQIEEVRVGKESRKGLLDHELDLNVGARRVKASDKSSEDRYTDDQPMLEQHRWHGEHVGQLLMLVRLTLQSQYCFARKDRWLHLMGYDLWRLCAFSLTFNRDRTT